MIILLLVGHQEVHAIHLDDMKNKFDELFDSSTFNNPAHRVELKKVSGRLAKKLLDSQDKNPALNSDAQMILAVMDMVHHHIVPYINAGNPVDVNAVEQLIVQQVSNLLSGQHSGAVTTFYNHPQPLFHPVPPPMPPEIAPGMIAPAGGQHLPIVNAPNQLISQIPMGPPAQAGGVVAFPPPGLVVAAPVVELQRQAGLLKSKEHQLQQEVRDFRASKRQEADKLRAMTSQVDESRRELQQAKKKERSLNLKLQNAQSKTKNEQDHARRVLDKQQAQVQKLQENVDDQDKQITEQKQQVEDLTQKLRAAEQENRKTTRERGALKKQLEQNQQQINELEQQVGHLQQEYKLAAKKAQQAKGNEEKLKQEQQQAFRNARQAEKTRQKAIKARQKVAEKEKALEEDRQELAAQQKALEEERQRHTKQQEEAAAKVEAQQKALEEERQRHAKQQEDSAAEVAATNARVKQMEDHLKQMQQELDRLKQQNAAVQEAQPVPVLRLKVPAKTPAASDADPNTGQEQDKESNDVTLEVAASENQSLKEEVKAETLNQLKADQMLAEQVAAAVTIVGDLGDLPLPEGNISPVDQRAPTEGALRNIAVADGAVNGGLMRRFKQFPTITTLAVSGTVAVGALAYFIQRLYRQPVTAVNHEVFEVEPEITKVKPREERHAEPLPAEVTKQAAVVTEQESQEMTESPVMDVVSEESDNSGRSDDKADSFTTSTAAADADAYGGEDCDVITDQALHTFCRKTLIAERRKNLTLLWQIRSQLLLVRYALRTLKGHSLEVSHTDLPLTDPESDRQFVLIAESQVTFSDLTDSERLQLFERVSRLQLPADSLLHQVQTLQVLGRKCGLMPFHFSDECLQQFDRGRVDLSLRLLGTLPAHVFELEAVLDRPDRFVIVPVWVLDDEGRHLTRMYILPVHSADGVLQLVSSDQIDRRNWVVPEMASYRIQTFTSERLWKFGKSIITHQAGQKVRLRSVSDSVVIYGHQMNPYAGVYADSNGKTMEYGWLRDGQLSESTLNLLWGLFEQSPEYNNEQTGDVMEWLALEYDRRLLVPEQRLNSLAAFDPADRQKYIARQEKGAAMAHFYPTAVRHFKEFEQSQTWQWGRLLAFAYRVSGLQAKGGDGRGYFHQAAHLCGVFPVEYSLYQLSCFLHVTELSEWRASDGLSLYLETINSLRAGNAEGLAVVALWPVAGPGNLLRPRFAPAVVDKQGWQIVTRQNSARTVERAFDVIAGQYKLYQLNPDFTLSLVDTLDISSDKAIYKVPAGSSIMVRRGDDSNSLFIHHPFSPFRQEPYPLFTSARFLHGAENIYPIAHFNMLRQEMEIEPAHEISNFQHGIYQCHALPTDSMQLVCNTLINNDEYHAADVLVSMYSRFGRYHLDVPVFCLQDSYEAGKYAAHEDALVDDKAIQRRLARIHKEPVRKGQPRELKLAPCEMRQLHNLPARWIVSTLREYLQAMDRYHLHHGQARLYYLLLSHCGLLGEFFRKQCTDRLLTMSATQVNAADPAIREAYFQSIGSVAKELIMARNPEGRHSMLLVNWHFDEQLKLQSEPAYRVNHIQFGAPIPVVEPRALKDTDGDFRIPMVITGLVPGKAYHIWRYDIPTGTWDDSQIRPPTFRIQDHHAVIEGTLAANWIYGLAEEGEPAPTSFHYFMLNDLPPSVRNSNARMQSELQPMPQPLWQQDIRLLPKVYWQRHGSH